MYCSATRPPSCVYLSFYPVCLRDYYCILIKKNKKKFSLKCFFLVNLFFKLDSWPRTIQTRFNFTIYPITFPRENEKEWRKLFKPCASQRLFLPVGLQSTSNERNIFKWLLWQRVLCVLCSSWSWRMWIPCSTWTQTSYSCSRSRRSGPFFLISIRAIWQPWRQSTRSRASAGTTALPVTLITAKLESTRGSCSWTWHASGTNNLRYFSLSLSCLWNRTTSLAAVGI